MADPTAAHRDRLRIELDDLIEKAEGAIRAWVNVSDGTGDNLEFAIVGLRAHMARRGMLGMVTPTDDEVAEELDDLPDLTPAELAATDQMTAEVRDDFEGFIERGKAKERALKRERLHDFRCLRCRNEAAFTDDEFQRFLAEPTCWICGREMETYKRGSL